MLFGFPSEQAFSFAGIPTSSLPTRVAVILLIAFVRFCSGVFSGMKLVFRPSYTIRRSPKRIGYTNVVWLHSQPARSREALASEEV